MQDALTILCHEEIKSRDAPGKPFTKILSKFSRHTVAIHTLQGSPMVKRHRSAHHRQEMRNPRIYRTVNFHSRPAQIYLAQGSLSPWSVKRNLRTFNKLLCGLLVLLFPLSFSTELNELHGMKTILVLHRKALSKSTWANKVLLTTVFYSCSLIEKVIQNSNRKEVMNKISI